MTTKIGRKIMNVLGVGGASALDALETLKARGPVLEQKLAEANQTLDAAQAGVAEKRSALDAAQAAFADAPTEGRGKAFRSARDELELAQLLVQKPREAVAAASRALDDWRAEVAAAEGKLEQERRAEHIENCRQRASLEGFNAAAAEPRERLRQALADMTAAADEITQLWTDANAAAAEVSAAGEEMAPLADFHQVASLILDHVEAHPENAESLRARFFDLAFVLGARLDLRDGLRGPLLATLENAQPSNDPQAAAQIRAALEKRTFDEALVAAHGGNAAPALPAHRFAPWERSSAAKGDADPKPVETDDVFDAATRALVNGLKALAGGALETEQAASPEKKNAVHSASTADEHFARIAPPSDHFTRLNS